MAISLLENYIAAKHHEVSDLLKELAESGDLIIEHDGTQLSDAGDIDEFIDDFEQFYDTTYFKIIVQQREVEVYINSDASTYTFKQIG